MANLTAKQQKYVDGLVAGLSQRQAYIQAGYSTKGKTDNYIDKEASVLFKNSKVTVRYNELMDEHKEKALWTREEAVSTLKWLLAKSMRSIENQDEDYVRQGTSNAILGVVKELNELELLYPLQRKQVDKIDSEIKVDEKSEDRLSDYFKALQEVYVDE